MTITEERAGDLGHRERHERDEHAQCNREAELVQRDRGSLPRSLWPTSPPRWVPSSGLRLARFGFAGAAGRGRAVIDSSAVRIGLSSFNYGLLLLRELID